MRIVLASESAGRRRALDILGLNYEVRPSAIDEKAIRDADPTELTRKLAEAKAWFVVESLCKGDQLSGPLAGPSSRDLPPSSSSSPSGTVASLCSGEFSWPSGEPAVVVAGDAVVAKDARIFEKPRDIEEAVEFLHELSGSAFRFVTSLVVIRTDTRKMLSAVETSELRFRQFGEREIRDYVSRYPVLRCAGAFEGDGVLRFAESVAGSYNFMTGLPVSCLAVFLRELGMEI
jgi:MAF protein